VRVTLKVKLVIVFMVIATLTAGVMYFVFVNYNANRFDQFVLDQQKDELVSSLANYYQSNGSWQGLAFTVVGQQQVCAEGQTCADPTASNGMGQGMGPGKGLGPKGQQTDSLNPRNGMGNPNYGDGRMLFGLADERGVLIIANRNNSGLLGLQLGEKVLQKGRAITVDGKTVGTLLMVDRLPSYNPAEQQFLDKTKRAYLVAFYGALIIAAILGVILASRFTKRISSIKKAAAKLSQGDLSQQVIIDGKDEVSDLGLAFNNMSQQLFNSNNLRKQMTADIAHDLRTPLTVVGGYVESMRDGDLEATPERLDVIHQEICHLEQLVGDLRLLSQSDAGELKLNLQSLDPAELLMQAERLFENEALQKKIKLNVVTTPGEITIQGDEGRLLQVLENLIANALHYTSEGGRVDLKSSLLITKTGPQCVIEVADTGTGIAPEELQLIFERFHRVDKSRHTDVNQSGLGLAIVRALVLAHGGQIVAESELGKGTKFKVFLPATLPQTR
jgi:signal transduction histidine kinase